MDTIYHLPFTTYYLKFEFLFKSFFEGQVMTCSSSLSHNTLDNYLKECLISLNNWLFYVVPHLTLTNGFGEWSELNFFAIKKLMKQIMNSYN